MHVKYEVSTSNGSKVIANVKVDNRQRQRQRDKQPNKQTDRTKTICTRSFDPGAKKRWYHVKGLVIRNTHVEYVSPISSGMKVMAEVTVYQK